MVSPLQQRKIMIAKRKLADSKAIDAGMGPITSSHKNDDWDFILSTLNSDLKQLKNIKQISQKNEYKEKQIKIYLPYLDQRGVPSELKMIVMVWAFDIGDMQRALALGLEGIEKGYSAPAFMKRDLVDFIGDEVLIWSDAQFKQGHSPQPYFDTVSLLVINTWNVHDVVRAKYLKLSGLMALGPVSMKEKYCSDPDALNRALGFFKHAEKIYQKAGVGTRIKNITARLEALVVN